MIMGVQKLDNHNCIIRIRVTVLLKREDGKICFVRHLKNGRRYWLLPGGGQDAFETAMQAASRELKEELGLDVRNFKLLFVRESMSNELGRHIQFLVFEGLNPDFEQLKQSTDPRVEGYDFLGPEEIVTATIYPSMREDILTVARGEIPEMFKTLEWIP